ncbi:acyl carrier protein [Jidongwangia harbinensis]|uniref:acyl carrier protein n=1 Tax=Jidongwangia harbinensis TaxID=2878561 RepID=UPI001CD9D450|nr:acyl carrier protein [Jidongwangia harbinensis]MCA2218261.1 acyl carrier protein [Jidongwangia harbinensis]
MSDTASTVDIEELRTLVADALELTPAEITDDASFADDLEVDSLTALEVAVRVEKHYGIKLAEPEFKQLTSLRSVRALVDAKLGEGWTDAR